MDETTAANRPVGREADRIFFAAAAQTPGASALEAGVPGATGARRLTYAVLAAEVRGHAAWLRTLGPPGVVAALTDDPAWSVPGLLAALDAGWTWVPLEPAWPAARRAAVVAAAAPGALLVDPSLNATEAAASLGLPAARVRRLDVAPRSADPTDPTPGVADIEAARPSAAASNLFFTSGTTGRPKGILGRPGALAHYVTWEAQLLAEAGLRLGPDLRVSALAPTTFDASLRDAALPLSVGGTVCVPPDRGVFADGARLATWLAAARVAVVHTVPTVFRALLAAEALTATPAGRPLPHLKAVLLAGEALRPSDVARFFARFGDEVALFNLYGPTETTMTRLWHRVVPADAEGPTVPLGRPMADTEVFVVDAAGRPRGPGRSGEIVLRSPWTSLGYLQRPEETARAFVPDLLGDGSPLPAYRTGDLGVLRPDGVLEFRGRRDLQVKLRGVRIELEEVEAALGAAPGVREAAAALRDGPDGEPRLVAWAAGPGDEVSWLAHLRRVLPAAAVPVRVVLVDALPRLVNGKVDRAALRLPAPPVGEGVPPEGPLEAQVAAVFAEVLSAARGGWTVGATDDFFVLGGDSLQALQTLWRLNEALGCELPVDLVYRARTVRGIAAWVANLPPGRPKAGVETRSEAETGRRADVLVAVGVEAPGEGQPTDDGSLVAGVVEGPSASPAPEVAAGRLFEALPLAHGAGRPVWWLPPAYGLSLPYRAVVGDPPALGRPAWALERLLGPEASTEFSVVQLARAAGEVLRTRQPEGPWTLVGWSFGGVLAWALAQQLCAEHGPAAVDRIVLLDTAAPGSGFDFTAGDARTAVLAAHRLGQLVGRDLHLDPEALRGLSAETLTHKVLDLAAANGLPVTPALRNQGLRVVALRTAALAALEAWQPSPWPEPDATEGQAPTLWILRAADAEADWTAGWSQLATGPRTRRTVAGDHQSMLEPPHAESLTAVIQEALGEAEDLDCEG